MLYYEMLIKKKILLYYEMNCEKDINVDQRSKLCKLGLTFITKMILSFNLILRFIDSKVKTSLYII